jgi:hypothetical protein
LRPEREPALHGGGGELGQRRGIELVVDRRVFVVGQGPALGHQAHDPRADRRDELLDVGVGEWIVAVEGGTLGEWRTLEHPIRPQTVEMQVQFERPCTTRGCAA